MRFVNKTGSTDNFALDITQGEQFTHRLAVVTNKGVQRLVLRDTDRKLVAERIGAKGISLSEDDIHAWVSEKLAN